MTRRPDTTDGADAAGTAPAGRIEPTEEQHAVLRSTARSIVLLANAGAAKTTTLALRIDAALAAGTAPERLLVLTSTQPACRAMATALARVGVPPGLARRVPVRTFDQFAAAVLLDLECRPVRFCATAEALAPQVRAAIRAIDLGADDGIVERFLQVARRLKGTLELDRLAWDGHRAADAETAELLGVEPALLRLFRAYEGLRDPGRDGVDRPLFRAEHDATYDLARLFADPEPTTAPAELAAWPRGLEQVLVDEMHDLNLAAFTILQALLADPGTRFCGVGDRDQVVHQNGGAEPRFIAPDVDLGSGRRVAFLPLTASWRFGAPLARAAGRLAGKAYATAGPNRTEVAALPYGRPRDGGDADASALPSCEEVVIAEVLRWKATPRARMSELAILLRQPYQSVLIENELLRAELPYATVGFDSYLLQPEVLLVRALLAVALRQFDALASTATRRRLVRAVVFFCGVELDHGDDAGESPDARLDEAIDHVVGEAAALGPFFEFQVLRNGEPAMVRRLEAAIEIARTVPGPEMFPRLLEALRMAGWVERVFVEKQRRADALAYLEGLARAARAYPSAQEFFAALNTYETRLHLADGARSREVRVARKAHREALTLATVAEVKGLEFDHVVIPYLAQGEFPARASTAPAEERNLFYVGITRARRRLTLVASAERPSPFLAAAGLGAGAGR